MRIVPTFLAAASLAAAAQAQTPDWIEHFPATKPAPRAGLMGVSDGSKLLVYGGNESATIHHNDLWSYDGANWTLEAATNAGPSTRMNYAAAWDAARGVYVLFGGRNLTTGDEGDTWEWSPGGGWTQVALAGATPGPRRWHELEYFPGIGCILHGGKDVTGTGTVYDDTWAWDGTTWTQLANGPYARQRGRMVYRTTHNDIIYYGGRSSNNTILNETWRFDGVAWTMINTTVQPGGVTGVFAHAMYYDPIRDLVVLFGGTQGAVEKNWTFEFDGTDWTEVFPPTTPGIRTAPALDWVAGSAKAFMFGGFSANQKDDTWERGAGSGTFSVSGMGCPTSTGQTATISGGSPTIGQNFVVDVSNTTTLAFPILALGFSDTSWALGPLPFPLSTLFPATPAGCDLYVSANKTYTMIHTPPTATRTLPIPNDPTLVGGTFFVQGLQVELLPAGLSIATTAYGTAVIGP